MNTWFADGTVLKQYDDRTRKVVLASLIIDTFTLATGIWLFWGIARQGLKRLRTKFLLGMFISNMLFSLLALISVGLDIKGERLQMHTRRCDVVGFLFVLIVLTQHAWSLTVAVVTYLMLKHPSSRAMYYIETYWYVTPIFIWCNAAFLAGVVFWKRDFSPSPGSAEWDYAIRGVLLSQKLSEFLPRLFAFCTMCTLYVSLFFFLRRSDTVNVGAVDNSVQSSWMSSLKQATGRRRKDIHATDQDLPPWERLELDFSGVVLLPPAPQPAERKGSVVSVISIIARSPVRMASVFKANPTTARGPLYHDSLSARDSGRQSVVAVLPDPGSNARFPPERDHGYSPSVKSTDAAEDSKPTLSVFLQDDKSFLPTQAIQELPSSQAIIESASAYFNHQASLLMFWFPIAYMVTLSPSLVRLSTEIATGREHATLKLIANLATISLGLQDVFIYGIVEWTIKRRVRRQLPAHL